MAHQTPCPDCGRFHHERFGQCPHQSVELLPCPFCGCDAVIFEADEQRNIVSCRLGHAPMRSIEAWNTRAECV
jgi:hypothetical protein